MKCTIIKDLMPSYLDEMCSEDTAELVKEHLKTCKDCGQFLSMMSYKDTYENSIANQSKLVSAKKPFKKIKRNYFIKLVSAIFVTCILTIIVYQTVQNIGFIHNKFFPNVSAVMINNDENENIWRRLYFDGSNFFVVTSNHFKHIITSSANSEGEIHLRIKDENNNILMESVSLLPGSSIKVDILKANVNYIVEAKYGNGSYFININ